MLDRKDQFRGCAQRVPAIRHQDAARVSARPFDRNAHTGRSGNPGNHSQRYLLPFQHRTLFDVQLDERLVVASRQLHFIELSAQPRLTAYLLDCLPVVVL